MRSRVIRFAVLAGVLVLFEGRLGLALAGLAALAYEVAGTSVSVLWVGALMALAAAPLAMLAQGLPSTAVVGADFAVGHVLARMLVQAALGLALYAIVAELTAPPDFERPPGLLRRMLQLITHGRGSVPPPDPAGQPHREG
jgi:hypothetical protein